jgi:hypothetical protein
MVSRALGFSLGITTVLFAGGAAAGLAPLSWSWRALAIALAVAGAVLGIVCWCSEFGWPHRRRRAEEPTYEPCGCAECRPPAGTLQDGLPELLRGHLDRGYGHEGPVTEEAERVARALLIRHLSDEQRRSFGNHGYFTVTLPEAWRPDFWYRRWRVPGLYGLAASPLGEDGTALPFALCVVPRVIQPESDTLLSTKLMLEHDPGRFLRVGLVHARR